MPKVDVPTLFLHATADTEVRMREVRAMVDSAASADTTLVQLEGLGHTMVGHRREAMGIVTDWLRERFPSSL